MKPITNIKTATKAWEILKKANLHYFLDNSLLYAVQKLSELKINISDIISNLLENGVLVEFLTVITDSKQYIGEDGKSTAWEEVPIQIIGELITDFFSDFMSVFKVLKK